MVLVPEAYQNNPAMATRPQLRAFYEYHEPLQEAWDGPALLVFSDGHYVGASLDRNGLRPARYMVTADDKGEKTVHVMSEVGVTKSLAQFSETGQTVSGERLLDSGRLGPGEMLTVDLKKGQFMLNDELKQSIAAQRPYGEWLKDFVVSLPPASFKLDIERFVDQHISDPVLQKAAIFSASEKTGTAPLALEIDNRNLIETQTYFGWGTEDVEVQITSMAAEAVEATYCMGDDAPLAALSVMPHTLFDYFKQRFAQVTNPPIDPLREGAVMSLSMFLGARGDPAAIDGQPKGQRVVKIDSPVLTRQQLVDLGKSPGISIRTLSTLYPTTQAVCSSLT